MSDHTELLSLSPFDFPTKDSKPTLAVGDPKNETLEKISRLVKFVFCLGGPNMASVWLLVSSER